MAGTDAAGMRIPPVTDVPEGAFDTFEVDDGRDIFVCRIAGKLYAVDNTCTHAGAWLHMGQLKPDSHEIICPLHGGAFDVRTGEPSRSPCTKALSSYEVRQEDDAAYLVKNNWYA